MTSKLLLGFALLFGLMTFPVSSQEEGLGLTEEQIKAIHAIRSDYVTRRKDVHTLLKEKKVELMKLLKSSEVDREAVKGKMAEIMDLELRRQHLFVDEMFDCRAKMDSDQWSTFRGRIVKTMLHE